MSMAHWSENAAKDAKEGMPDQPAEEVVLACGSFNVLSYPEIIEAPEYLSAFEVIEEPHIESGFEVIEEGESA
jgi:hypothetical protein